ncbi:integral peroxisomal membrane peroxin-domain-containing protein [Phellopilus nigrolimitatus]|nr:integral peroxisomal membrane peroxin-domain-containing protein [Phellopilus nigrolimitatus]
MDYAQIPTYATLLDAQASIAPKIATSPPKSGHSTVVSSTSSQIPQSPTKQPFNIPSAILASGLAAPSPTPRTPRKAPDLLSTRDPLSLPMTTTHFRRFAAKCGPIFWLQDRAEEVLMWKRGWKVTSACMVAYAFLCYFPKLFLALPHVILLTVLLSAHTARQPSPSRSIDSPSSPPYTQPAEGSPEWFSNLQAIQNLMGVVGDTHDYILYTIVPHLTFSTPYSYSILTFTIVTFLFLIAILPLIPLRPVFLILGLGPFVLTHPFSRAYIPILLASHIKSMRMRVSRLVDDDRLEDRHWQTELQEVELWENERLGPGPGGALSFSKLHLKVGERKGWTRGRDGWSKTGPDGSGDVSSNLTFSLERGWAFVETEDWRKDLEASWVGVDSDDDGWIYTNDAWMDPCNAPAEEWKASGVTRRRRWIRRTYRSPLTI